ncbi:MAG: hypothetical protein V4529_06345 [Gemmatimonadota bacterium]
MPDRHYDEDEVAAIFRAAAEGSDSRTLPGGRADGLTLDDLQDIAREVGISPTALGALRLPRWARLRRRQMDDVAARLTRTMQDPT